MPYDTKELLKDKRKVPIPQFYDPATDAFLPLTGVALGNGRYAADGLIWGKTAGGLYVPVKVADDGTLNAQLTGSIETVNDNPVTGIKTVTATAAEIFAGASRKANRRKMIIKNEDTSLRFRIGKSDVTQQNGFPVEPGAIVEFQFDPAVAVPIYAISEGANLEVSVMEI